MVDGVEMQGPASKRKQPAARPSSASKVQRQPDDEGSPNFWVGSVGSKKATSVGPSCPRSVMAWSAGKKAPKPLGWLWLCLIRAGSPIGPPRPQKIMKERSQWLTPKGESCAECPYKTACGPPPLRIKHVTNNAQQEVRHARSMSPSRMKWKEAARCFPIPL